jgi:hypothetical protein
MLKSIYHIILYRILLHHVHILLHYIVSCTVPRSSRHKGTGLYKSDNNAKVEMRKKVQLTKCRHWTRVQTSFSHMQSSQSTIIFMLSSYILSVALKRPSLKRFQTKILHPFHVCSNRVTILAHHYVSDFTTPSVVRELWIFKFFAL